MDIERSSTFTILEGGRSLLTPSYFLLRWTYITTNTPTYCICTNIGNDDGPILLQVTETGAVTPDPFTGEVQLASGDHQLEVWEQTSSTNLFPPDTAAEFSELVRVADSAIPVPPPVNPCLGCGDPTCDPFTITVNGDAYDEVADPCGDTLDIPIYDSDGTLVATTIVGGQVRVDDLPCAGGCDYDGIVNINGVQVATFGPFDPCVDNTVNINLN